MCSVNADGIVGMIVHRERRWTPAGATPARELVRSTRLWAHTPALHHYQETSPRLGLSVDFAASAASEPTMAL